MQRIELSDAAKEIALASMRTPAAVRRPFVFLFGAGVSYPSVPLAGAIERHCHEEAQRIGREDLPLVDSSLMRYSHWFSLAYPHAMDRQAYLKNLIENKPVSSANLRLAHLLGSEKVATIAITPNFDPFLSKALALFGRGDHRLCDHPATVDRIDPESTELQIVHVHGTYWFYDQCNLVGEIDNRAEFSRETAFTMLGLLDRILANRAAIVLGYSGWEGDVIMTALKRRLYPQRRLPFRMYWFCYSQDSLLALPDWLTEHPDVYFIAPQESDQSLGPNRDFNSPERASLSHLSSGVKGESEVATGSKQELGNVLPAVRVLDELIRALDLDEPDITRDPLQHFAAQLRNLLSEDDLIKAETDPYSFRSVISRLERAHERAIFADQALEDLRGSVRRSRYIEGVEAAGRMQIQDLDRDQVVETVELLLLCSRGLSDTPVEALRGYQELERITANVQYEQLAAHEKVLVLSGKLQHARALFNIGEFEQASETLDSLVSLVSALPAEGTEQILLDALRLNSFAAMKAGHIEKELRLYSRIIALFERIPDQDGESGALIEELAYAMTQRGLTFEREDKKDAALADFQSVLKRFGNTTNDYIRSQVILSHVSMAIILREKGKVKQAAKHLDGVIKSYAPVPFGSATSDIGDLAFHYLMMGMLEKASLMTEAGRPDAALETYEAVTRIVESSEHTSLNMDFRAQALVESIGLLASMRRFDEALPHVTSLAVNCRNETIKTALIDNLRGLATGPKPPYGIKGFEATVRKILTTHHV